MKRRTRHRRDWIIETESRKIAWIFSEHLGSGDLQAGVDALEAHWIEVRHSPVSKWLRFKIVSWKVELLHRMGRLEEALVECNNSLSLPANLFARTVSEQRRTNLLRNLGRPGEAFQCAMTGLKICAKTDNVHSSQFFVLEIVRLGKETYLERLAEKYGPLVLNTLALPNQMLLIGPVPVETAIQGLMALRGGIMLRQTQMESQGGIEP